MHLDFEREMMGLIGRKIEDISLGETNSHMLFQFHIGDRLVCFEVAKPDRKNWGGRAFMMSDKSVDGAGVFPLR